MESSAELIKWVLENLNYWVVTIFMTIESSFIPFPSEVIVPPAAWKAMTDDSMNIFLVVIFATIGADLGALINYYLARWLGRPIVYKFANSRFGHMLMKQKYIMLRSTSENMVLRPLSSDALFLRYGNSSVSRQGWQA